MNHDLKPVVTSAKHVPVIAGGTFVQVYRVTIMIGNNGPFTKDFPVDQAGPEVINAWINGEVQRLMALPH